MRCLINISSTAFLSELCPLTLLLTLRDVGAQMQLSASVPPPPPPPPGGGGGGRGGGGGAR